jgi:hypothetical protein
MPGISETTPSPASFTGISHTSGNISLLGKLHGQIVFTKRLTEQGDEIGKVCFGSAFIKGEQQIPKTNTRAV